MNWPVDPNSIFGTAGPLATALVLANSLLSGVYSIVVVSWLCRLPPWPFLLVSAWYSLVGSMAYIFLGPFSLGADGSVYDAQAATLGSSWGGYSLIANEVTLDQGKWGYPILLGITYMFDGRVPLVGPVFNSVVVSLTAILVTKASRDLFGRVQIHSVVAWFLFFPGFLALGAGISREPVSWFGAALLTSTYIQSVMSGFRLKSVVLFSIALAWLFWMRAPLAVLAFMGLIAAEIVRRVWLVGKLPGLILGLSAAFVVLLAAGERLLSVVGLNVSSVLATREYLSSAATTGYSVNPGPLAGLGWVGHVVAGLPHVVLGPFPWHISADIVWLWVAINTVAWWLAIVAVWRNWYQALRKDTSWALIGLATVILVGMGITLTNYGIVVRIRLIPLIVLLPMIVTSSPPVVMAKDLRRRTGNENRITDQYRANTRRVLP